MGALILLVPLVLTDTIQRMLYETVANKQARGKKIRYALNYRRTEHQALMTGADNTERFQDWGLAPLHKKMTRAAHAKE
jgi:hypothetical protein